MNRSLLDYCEISGKTVTKFNGQRKYIATADINGNTIISGDFVSYNDRPSRANQNVEVGELLFAKMMATKKVLQINEENKDFIYSTGFYVIKPNKEIDSNYLYWFFNSNNFNLQKDKNCIGATMKGINNAGLKKIELKQIPNINIQKNRSFLLNKINDAIKNREEVLNDFAYLLESTFDSMFGNLTNNRKSLPVFTFADICKVRQGLQIPISERKKEDGNNRYKYITIQYLNGKKDIEFIEGPKANVICKKDDILMTRTGNTGMVITNVEGVFHNNFFLIDFDKKIIERDYLIFYLNTPLIQKELIMRATTSTIPDLSHSEFYKIKIIVPPVEVQKKFANIYRNVEIQKQLINQDIKDLESLLETKMHEYFD